MLEQQQAVEEAHQALQQQQQQVVQEVVQVEEVVREVTVVQAPAQQQGLEPGAAAGAGGDSVEGQQRAATPWFGGWRRKSRVEDQNVSLSNHCPILPESQVGFASLYHWLS